MHIVVLLPPQHNISCVDINNQALFFKKTLLGCIYHTLGTHQTNWMREWLILPSTTIVPNLSFTNATLPLLKSYKWEVVWFLFIQVPETPTVHKPVLIAPCSDSRTVFCPVLLSEQSPWLFAVSAVPSHFSLQNRLQVSFGNPNPLGSHSLRYAKLILFNPNLFYMNQVSFHGILSWTTCISIVPHFSTMKTNNIFR